MGDEKIFQPKRILYFFILVNLILGLIIVSDFGRSTDESLEGKRSQLAYQIYSGKLDTRLDQAYEEFGNLKYYGTASTTIFRFVERYFFSNIDHSTLNVAHFGYFVFFQGAVIAMFFLGRRFFGEWLSLGVAILFGTQPLFFGHAFINPKDIPLLTVFMFTIVAGFRMVDEWQQNNAPVETHETSPVPEDPATTKQKKRQQIFIFVLLIFFILIWSGNWIMSQILTLVEYSYETRGESILGRLFSAVTTQGSLEGYITLAEIYILKMYRWIVFVIPVSFLILFYYAQKNRLFGKSIDLSVLLAAGVWGFAISTRVVAVAAGGIVGLYALVKLKEKVVFSLIIYTLTASIFSYISWPFLWLTGFRGLWEALITFSDFQHNRLVFFEGQEYLPSDLPARYLPKLMMLQFTVPVVILAVLGFLMGVFFVYQKKLDTSKYVLISAWFLLPMLYTTIMNTARYGNFRQYFFITPPLFIFTGLALRPVASLFKRKAWVALLCLILSIPGLYQIIQLHPYQYLFYNEFTGGVEGAFGNYELDYWNTAYRDMMAYVNENIPAGSEVLVMGNDMRARLYATSDISLETYQAVTEEEYSNFNYVIIPTHKLEDQLNLPVTRLIYDVQVDNISLMVIKQIIHGDT